jgi:hypothetical protein
MSCVILAHCHAIRQLFGRERVLKRCEIKQILPYPRLNAYHRGLIEECCVPTMSAASTKPSRETGVAFHAKSAFRPLRLNSSEWRLDSLACIVLINVAEFAAKFKQKPRGGIIERLQCIQSRGEVLGLG